MKTKGRSGSDLNLVDLARNGFWYCQRCERHVALSEKLDSPAHCPHCRKQTAVWMPPVNLEPGPAELALPHSGVL